MDLSILEALIPNVAAWLNVDPATVLLWLGLFCTICNLIGRLIPDDRVGVLGKVRELCKIIGLYTPNRVADGITVNDVARSIVRPADTEVLEAASQPETLIPEVGEVAKPVVPAFPGLNRDPATGRFVSSKGEEDGSQD